MATVTILWLALAVPAADGNSQALAAKARPAIDKAVTFLQKNRNDDGSFGEGELKIPFTGLILTGLLQSKAVPLTDPLIADGLAYLESKVQSDGGLEGGRAGRNYTTSICVMAFALANQDGKYRKLLDDAARYLTQEQWDEGEGISPSDPKYGGAGYGSKSRPDLSNTSFMLDALKAADLPEDDPAFQRAIVFIRRCQNLSGEGANDLPFGDEINDGGFYYTPIDDSSPAGGNKSDGLRSYGSMTYAGLKSFLYAGVKPDDFRVKAAYEWIQKHYTLEQNPPLGASGLYYYYHTFAKALAAMDLEEVIDESGKAHDWRAELIDTLVKQQKPDGSWANSDRRWMETEPRLVTAYSLMAIGQAIGP